MPTKAKPEKLVVATSRDTLVLEAKEILAVSRWDMVKSVRRLFAPTDRTVTPCVGVDEVNIRYDLEFPSEEERDATYNEISTWLKNYWG